MEKEVKAVGRKAPIVKTNSKLKEYLRKPGSLIMLILIMLAAAITVGIMVYLVAYIVIRGVPYINADLFAWKYNSDNVSMTPAIINTIIIVAMTLIISVPIGVAAAIYLVEYAKRGSKLVKIIRVTTETLAGIPSIVFGLFGFLAFVLALHWGYSLIAGVLTLAIMVLPTIIRTTEEALIAVPDSFREGSFGLGAGKLRTIFVIVLPAAVPGILSGVILAIGRIVGESAALIFTAGSVAAVPWGSGKFFLSSTRTLAVHMYCLLSEGLYTNQAYATAVIQDMDLFYGDFHAIKDVNLSIPKNQITAFIGPSGCGKSTVLKSLNRMNDLVVDCKIQGKITLDGVDIYKDMDVNDLRKRVGMVFQKANLFPMSIYDNIAYGPRTHGIRSKAKLDEIVERTLKQAAIWDEVKDSLKKNALAMSGGQQQRLCIARALAVEPEVLLMDEPTSALDPISTSKIEDLATELKKDYTIVMVTHNMQQAARISDNTAFFLLGEVVEYSDTEQMFSMPRDKRTEDYITGRFG